MADCQSIRVVRERLKDAPDLGLTNQAEAGPVIREMAGPATPAMAKYALIGALVAGSPGGEKSRFASRVRRRMPSVLFGSARSAEQRIDVVLRGVADVLGELRSVEQPGIALTLRDLLNLDALEGLQTTPDLHHAQDMRLDEFQGPDNLADALAGQILEITGLEDLDDSLLHVLRQRVILIILQASRQCVRDLIDLFSIGENGIGRARGAADNGVEFVSNARHLRPFEA